MSNIELLRERTKRLLDLLDDAHPGLMTWRESFDNALESVAEFCPHHPSEDAENESA